MIKVKYPNMPDSEMLLLSTFPLLILCLRQYANYLGDMNERGTSPSLRVFVKQDRCTGKNNYPTGNLKSITIANVYIINYTARQSVEYVIKSA